MSKNSTPFFRRRQRVFIKPGIYYPGTHADTPSLRTGRIHEPLGGGRAYGVRITGHPHTVDYSQAELATSPWPTA